MATDPEKQESSVMVYCLSLGGRLGAVIFALGYWILLGSYVLSVWRHRDRNFILELRLPTIQILEAVVNGIAVTLLLAQHAVYGLLGPVPHCDVTHAATAVLCTFIPGLISIRSIRGVIVINREWRKRYRAFTGRKGVMAAVVVNFFVALACFYIFKDAPVCHRTCRPTLCMMAGNWIVMVIITVHILSHVWVSVLIKKGTKEDPLSTGRELQQVVTILLGGMVALLPILICVDGGFASSPLYRLAGHVVTLTMLLGIYFLVCLGPAVRHGYGPAILQSSNSKLFGWLFYSGVSSGNLYRVAPEGEGASSASVFSLTLATAPTRGKDLIAQQELFGVLNVDETRGMYLEFCRTTMCEDHALFVIEYRDFEGQALLHNKKRREFRTQLLDMVNRYLRDGGDQNLELDLRVSFFVTRKAYRFGLRKNIFKDEAREMQDIVESVYRDVLRKLAGPIFNRFKISAPYQAWLSHQALVGRRAVRDDFFSYFSVGNNDDDGGPAAAPMPEAVAVVLAPEGASNGNEGAAAASSDGTMVPAETKGSESTPRDDRPTDVSEGSVLTEKGDMLNSDIKGSSGRHSQSLSRDSIAPSGDGEWEEADGQHGAHQPAQHLQDNKDDIIVSGRTPDGPGEDASKQSERARDEHASASLVATQMEKGGDELSTATGMLVPHQQGSNEPTEASAAQQPTADFPGPPYKSTVDNREVAIEDQKNLQQPLTPTGGGRQA